MPSLTELSAASSVAAADQLLINQSGTDKRVTADKFAIVGLANTFAAAQTMPRVTMPQVTYTTNQTISVGLPMGLLVLVNLSAGTQGLIWLAGGANDVASISLRGGVTVTKDTANSINVYYDSTYGYVIQNKYATNQTLAYVVIGAG